MQLKQDHPSGSQLRGPPMPVSTVSMSRYQGKWSQRLQASCLWRVGMMLPQATLLEESRHPQTPFLGVTLSHSLVCFVKSRSSVTAIQGQPARAGILCIAAHCCSRHGECCNLLPDGTHGRPGPGQDLTLSARSLAASQAWCSGQGPLRDLSCSLHSLEPNP